MGVLADQGTPTGLVFFFSDGQRPVADPDEIAFEVDSAGCDDILRRLKRSRGAMGGWSALQYAQAAGIPDASKHRWEWLHLLGASLGGPTIEGNLVAGTYDSNTQMTAVETAILELREKVFRKPDEERRGPDDDEKTPPSAPSLRAALKSAVQPVVIVQVTASLYRANEKTWYIADHISVKAGRIRDTPKWEPEITGEFTGTEAAVYSKLELAFHRWLAMTFNRRG